MHMGAAGLPMTMQCCPLGQVIVAQEGCVVVVARQIAIVHLPFFSVQCAHAEVPSEQTWQM